MLSFWLPIVLLASCSNTNPKATGNTELNELKDWLVYGRASNKKASIAIKADGNTPITAIKTVMKTLKNQDVLNYSLITNLEGMPTNLPK